MSVCLCVIERNAQERWSVCVCVCVCLCEQEWNEHGPNILHKKMFWTRLRMLLDRFTDLLILPFRIPPTIYHSSIKRYNGEHQKKLQKKYAFLFRPLHSHLPLFPSCNTSVPGLPSPFLPPARGCTDDCVWPPHPHLCLPYLVYPRITPIVCCLNKKSGPFKTGVSKMDPLRV